MQFQKGNCVKVLAKESLRERNAWELRGSVGIVDSVLDQLVSVRMPAGDRVLFYAQELEAHATPRDSLALLATEEVCTLLRCTKPTLRAMWRERKVIPPPIKGMRPHKWRASAIYELIGK